MNKNTLLISTEEHLHFCFFGPSDFGELNLFLHHHPWGCFQWLWAQKQNQPLLSRSIKNSRNCTEHLFESLTTEKLDRSDYGLTYSLINSSSWAISPAKPDASATVTLLWHCENAKTSPGTPSVNSFTTSADDTALLDARNFSLLNKAQNKQIKECRQSKRMTKKIRHV